MITLRYKVIKSRKQYFEYCSILNELLAKKPKLQRIKDEIELLTVLIEKWDKDHSKFKNADPVSLLKFLLQQHNMTAQDLVKVPLNYKKGLSKETVRKLATHFKMDQAAFNRQYSFNKAQQNKSLKWLAKQAQKLNLGY